MKKKVMICLSEKAIVKAKARSKKEGCSMSGLIESMINKEQEDVFGNDTCLMVGDIKDLPSLKYIVLVKNPDQFPQLNEVTWFEHKQKGMIEVNKVIYMNHPSSITDFVEEYAEKVETSVFGFIKELGSNTLSGEIKGLKKVPLLENGGKNTLSGEIKRPT